MAPGCGLDPAHEKHLLMKSVLRASTLDDLPLIRRMLLDVFHAPEDFPSVDSTNLNWKYFAARTDYSEPRSFLAEREGAIVAHGAVWPGSILTMAGRLPSLHVIDWAGKPEVAGAGTSLMMQLSRKARVTCAAGGSEDTRKLLPLLGFRPRQKLSRWARPLRPWKQLLTHPYRNAKLPARLVRNLAWRYSRPLAAPRGWSFELLSPVLLPESLLPRPEPGLSVFERSNALFEYLVACPVASIRLFVAYRDREPLGYFCLSFVPGSARIIDAWVTGDNWRALYRLAIRAALEQPDVCEIVTVAGIERATVALAGEGFRPLGDLDLNLLAGKDTLPDSGEYHFQMVDSDIGFLHSRRPEYVT